jgi:hypothetical protein
MQANSITYRDIDEADLIKFCENNLTDNARLVIGVFLDTDGVWKVDGSNYAYLVKCFFEAQMISKGKLNGKVDFIMKPQTDIVQ